MRSPRPGRVFVNESRSRAYRKSRRGRRTGTGRVSAGRWEWGASGILWVPKFSPSII